MNSNFHVLCGNTWLHQFLLKSKQKQQRLMMAERRGLARNRGGGTDSPRPDSRRSVTQR